MSPEFDKAEIGRDAFTFYNHGGAVAVASAWLVLYVIAAIAPARAGVFFSSSRLVGLRCVHFCFASKSREISTVG
jgi:hypothetical protein